jgi:hypothetical protein
MKNQTVARAFFLSALSVTFGVALSIAWAFGMAY